MAELPEEPEIIINGKRLSHGEAMTVRMAVSLLIMETYPGGFMLPANCDATGREIAMGYQACGKMIIAKIRET